MCTLFILLQSLCAFSVFPYHPNLHTHLISLFTGRCDLKAQVLESINPGWGPIPSGRCFWCFTPHPFSHLWFQLQCWQAALCDLLCMPTRPHLKAMPVHLCFSGQSILWILEPTSQHNRKVLGNWGSFPSLGDRSQRTRAPVSHPLDGRF